MDNLPITPETQHIMQIELLDAAELNLPDNAHITRAVFLNIDKLKEMLGLPV